MTVPADLTLGKRSMRWGRRTFIMGVLNVTPDSFSDGGRFGAVPDAVAAGVELWRVGADIVDVGGESTRPGAPAVAVAEEIARVVPVVAGLRAAGVDAISIDTRKSEVARAALSAGAVMINDVSGGLFDRGLMPLAAGAGAAYVIMHSRDIPERMQLGNLHYDDVVAAVREVLARAIERALAAGLPRARILVDPGIGFGKTVEHNLQLTRNLAQLRSLGHAVVYGPSRKSFLGHLTGVEDPRDRLEATLAAVVLGVFHGADLVRVHDVPEVRRALAIADAVCRCV